MKGGVYMNKYLVLAASSAVVFSSLFAPAVHAEAGTLTTEDLGTEVISNTINLGDRDIRTTIASIINVALGMLGIVAVVLILYGGFIWMTAGGEEEKTKKAKNLIIQGIIGMVIILSAWAIASFVLGSLVNATTATE